MSKDLKAALKAARDALKEGKYEHALQHCKVALKTDKQCYNAYVFAGAAAEGLENATNGEQAYRKAIDIEPDTPLAYQGLARLFENAGDVGAAKLVPVYSKLASILKESEPEKSLGYLIKLADLQAGVGDVLDAGSTWKTAFPSVVASGLSPGDKLALLSRASDALEAAAHHQLNASTALSPEDRLNVLRSYQLEDVLDAILAIVPESDLRYDWMLKAASLKRRYYWLSRSPELYREAFVYILAWADTRAIDPKPLEFLLEMTDEDPYAPDCQSIEELLERLRVIRDDHPLVTVYCAFKSLDMAALTLATQKYPVYATTWLLLCRGYMQLGQYEQARALCSKGLVYLRSLGDRVAAISGKLVELELIGAHCLSEIDESNWPAAKEKYAAVLSAHPGSCDALLGWSKLSIKEKKLDEGLDLLRKALTLPDVSWEKRAQVLAEMGDVEFALGKYQDAEKAYLSSLELTAGSELHDSSKKTCSKAHFGLGRMYYHWDDLHKADKEKVLMNLLKAASLNPQAAETFAYLGHYYADAGDNVRAWKCWEKAVDMDPNQNTSAQRLCRELVYGGELGKAREVYMKVAQAQGPRAAWAWHGAGLIHLVCLLIASAGHDTFVFCHMMIANHAQRENRCPEAITCFQSMLRGDSRNPNGWDCLGEAYVRLGKYVAAIKALKRALSFYDATGEVAADTAESAMYCRLRLGHVYRMLGHFNEALAEFQHCLNLRPEYLPVTAGLAETLADYSRSLFAEGRVGASVARAAEGIGLLCTALPFGDARQSVYKVLGDLCAIFAQLATSACRGLDTPEFQTLLRNASAAFPCYEPFATSTNMRERLLALGASAYRVAIAKGENFGLHCDLAVTLLAHDRLLKAEGTGRRTLIADAIDAGKRAVTLAPAQGRAWETLGVCAALGRLPGLAQHAFIKAIQLQPTSAGIWANLGVFYLLHGNMQLAHQAFAQAQAHDPALARAWVGQALVAESMGDDVTDDLFRHTAELCFEFEGYVGFAQRTFRAFAEGGHRHLPHSREVLSTAAQALEQYVARDPADACAQNLLGLLLEAMSMQMSARQAFERARVILEAGASDSAEKAGHLQDVYVNLARAHMATGEYAEAEQLYVKTDIETDLQCVLGLAAARFKAGRLAESAQAYHHALVMANTTGATGVAADIHAALGLVAYGLADAATAHSHMVTCLQIEPTHVRCLFGLATLGLVQSNQILAASALLEAANLDPSARLEPKNAADYCLLKACLCIVMNQTTQAARVLSKAIHTHGHLYAGVWASAAHIILNRLPDKAPAAVCCSSAAAVLAKKSGLGYMEKAIVSCMWAHSVCAVGGSKAESNCDAAKKAARLELLSGSRRALNQKIIHDAAQKAAHIDPSSLAAWSTVAATQLARALLMPELGLGPAQLAVRVTDFVRVISQIVEADILAENGNVHPLHTRLRAARLISQRDWATFALCEAMGVLSALDRADAAAHWQQQLQSLCHEATAVGGAGWQWYRLLARSLHNRPDTAEGIDVYKQALQHRPDSALMWQELAQCYSRARQFLAADLCYKEVLKATAPLSPANLAVYVRMAALAQMQGNRQVVADALGQALKIKNQYFPALLLQGVEGLQKGDNRQARRFLMLALEQSGPPGTSINSLVAGLLDDLDT